VLGDARVPIEVGKSGPHAFDDVQLLVPAAGNRQ
jgi:hypothetical protein